MHWFCFFRRVFCFVWCRTKICLFQGFYKNLSRGFAKPGLSRGFQKIAITLSFSPVLAPGKKVFSREGHTIASVKNELVLWGGAQLDDENPDGNVFVLKEGEWKPLLSDASSFRIGACSASCGESVFLFGGVDPDQGCWLNDILQLDLVSRQISAFGPGANGPTPRDKGSVDRCRTSVFVAFWRIWTRV
jgi:hypothetical protein